MTRPDDSLGIYLHAPFCASRCPYCDFYSHCPTGEIPAYVRAMEREIRTLAGCRAFADESVFARRVESVYLGGGTPSLLPPGALRALLDPVRKAFPVAPDAEITLEANPSLPEPEAYFAAAAGAGVNRVSLGLQSAVDAERRALGRRSGREAADRCLRAAAAAGIRDLSLDLMLGIPGQTPDSLEESVSYCLETGVTHISAYLLKIEPGTVFDRRRDRLDLPDEDAAADLYLQLCGRLREAGWRHYEISNFCRDGRVGRHNLRYWQDREYLGFGPAAHGYCGGKRYYYAPDLDGFLRGDPCVYEGPGGDPAERLMLALRTDEGLDPAAFSDRYGLRLPPAFYEEAALLRSRGLLADGGGPLRLTETGMLVSNAVILRLTAQLPV